MKLVILRQKLQKVRQHPQEQQQQTSFKDLLENSRSKMPCLKILFTRIGRKEPSEQLRSALSLEQLDIFSYLFSP